MSVYEPDMTEPEGEPPLAAEFVLGLVQGTERDILEIRAREDWEFAAEVAFWESRLGPIAEGVAPSEVPAHVWDRIAREIGHAPEPLATSVQPSLWNSLVFWRGLGLATSALAAACLVFLFASPASPPPSLVAALQLDNGSSAFMATVDRMTGRVMLMPAADTPPPPEHTHELWLIPVNGTPHSLGTFAAGAPVTMALPAELMPHAGSEAVLAISVEPMGGSTTGQPTGPVVAHGKMQEL